jgi:hypothetical protein
VNDASQEDKKSKEMVRHREGDPMAYDLILGQTRRDWSLGSLPKGVDYAPKTWWSETQAEAEVQRHMKSSFLTPGLPRKDAEETVLDYMKAHKIGIMSGSGSLLIPSKQQKAFLSKIDDVRYDLRHVGNRIGIAMICLSAALGAIAISSVYRTAKGGQ